MMKPKARRAHKIKGWATKGKKKMKGGFLSIILGILISLGVEAASAASIAAVAAPIVSGVASASAGYAATKILKKVGGSRLPVRTRIRKIKH